MSGMCFPEDVLHVKRIAQINFDLLVLQWYFFKPKLYGIKQVMNPGMRSRHVFETINIISIEFGTKVVAERL